MGASIKIAACQVQEIIDDVEASIACIEHYAAEATKKGADLVLFPECFLQGYLLEESRARESALNLHSQEFNGILKRLAYLEPVLVFGLIELDQGKLFNTAVVVDRGKLVGTYRKTHIHDGEKLFNAGTDYPVFNLKGVNYGLNICYDMNFPEAAKPLAQKGAKVMLGLAQNMLKLTSAEKWKELHNQIRAERVRETGMWLISSDVTGRRGDTHIGYGPTSAMNPKADLVQKVPLLQEGMIVVPVVV